MFFLTINQQQQPNFSEPNRAAGAVAASSDEKRRPPLKQVLYLKACEFYIGKMDSIAE